MALRRIEETILLELTVCNHVIATGGSAIYSEAAISHLKSDGVLVFLDVGLSVLESRVKNFRTRGLAISPSQRFDDLYQERLPLYRKYADIVIKCRDLSHERVCAMIDGSL